MSLGPLGSNVKLASKNLGVLFDQYINFEGHIKKVVQSCFFQLRNIAKIRNVLSPQDLKKIIHIFVLNYCNSLYTALTKNGRRAHIC